MHAIHRPKFIIKIGEYFFPDKPIHKQIAKFYCLTFEGKVNEIRFFFLSACIEFNLFASGFKWLQATFAYDILFTMDLNFSTWFTKNFNIPGTKQD